MEVQADDSKKVAVEDGEGGKVRVGAKTTSVLKVSVSANASAMPNSLGSVSLFDRRNGRRCFCTPLLFILCCICRCCCRCCFKCAGVTAHLFVVGHTTSPMPKAVEGALPLSLADAALLLPLQLVLVVGRPDGSWA